MCFREITCCDPAILSIMFVHGEDMQLFDIHGKEGVDMIVQMDAIECKKAGSDSLLAARTTVVPENSIRWDSRGETESAHHPMRWLRLSTCLRRL
jgi:hypothetical protein